MNTKKIKSYKTAAILYCITGMIWILTSLFTQDHIYFIPLGLSFIAISLSYTSKLKKNKSINN